MKQIKKIICMTLVIIYVFITAIGANLPALASDNCNVSVPAVPILYTILLSGHNYNLQAFTINGHDYFKLRDIAFILDGTIMQFRVGWDALNNAIYIKPGQTYNKTGGELAISDSIQTALSTTSKIFIDDKITDDSAYSINGNTYMKITDIADSLDFQVDIDPTSSKIAIRSAPIDPNSYVLTLIAYNNKALFNGIPITLSAQPFIQNDTFYIPLEAVTKLLGGTYSFENNVATVELFGNTYNYQIGSHTIIINGETYTVSGDRALFSITQNYIAVDDKYVPIVLDSTVFIPSRFIGYHCPYQSVLEGIREYPQSLSVILGGFKNESGIREVKLEDIYDDLPVDFRSKLNYEGVVGEVLIYNIEKYKNYELEVYVMRLKEPSEDIEHMDGRVCAIKVMSYQYSTPRGLKPTDSAYRAWLLYGYENLSYSFLYKVSSGTVESLIFYTRYYGSQL